MVVFTRVGIFGALQSRETEAKRAALEALGVGEQQKGAGCQTNHDTTSRPLNARRGGSAPSLIGERTDRFDACWVFATREAGSQSPETRALRDGRQSYLPSGKEWLTPDIFRHLPRHRGLE